MKTIKKAIHVFLVISLVISAAPFSWNRLNAHASSGESDWVLASEAPPGAVITSRKYSYTQTTYTESTATSLPGYSRYDAYWSQTASGGMNWATFPSSPSYFDTAHWIYTGFAKSRPYHDAETETYKRVSNNSWGGYVFWHWMYNTSNSSAGDRAIYDRIGTGPVTGYTYNIFGAFASQNGYTYKGFWYNNNLTTLPTYYQTGRTSYADSQGSHYWFRFEYYNCTYVDYQRIFKYYKTDNLESSTYPTGSNISNIREWVKYQLTLNTLTVDPNGGVYNGSSEPSTFTGYIKDKVSLAVPTKSKADFLGWRLDGEGTIPNFGRALFKDTYFENSLNGMEVYNNAGNGTVSLQKVTASADCPTDAAHMVKVSVTGTPSPGLGGFVQSVNNASCKIFYQVIVAKIPSGCTISSATNSTGMSFGANTEWLTPRKGTGKWETYIVKRVCEPIGIFGTTGHIFISGSAASAENHVSWYVAYANIFDATGTSLFSGTNLGAANINIYNNLENGQVSHSLVASDATVSPYQSTMLKITTSGAATPGMGGFYQLTDSAAGKTFYHYIYAKIPVGYKIDAARNPIGNGGYHEWLTPQEGTGDWKLYIYKIVCGTDGTFSTFGFAYLTPLAGYPSSPVTWYVCYTNVFDTTDSSPERNFIFGLETVKITAIWREHEAFIPEETAYYNGKLYARYNYSCSWREAKDICRDFGGDLVSITSEEEHAFVSSMLGQINNRNYWIGAYYDDQENSFSWSSGEVFDYSSWDIDEATNPKERYSLINGISGKWKTTFADGTNFANIYDDDDKKLNNIGFICEINAESFEQIDAYSFGGKTYRLFDNKLNWADAKSFSESIGGTLVIINTEEENELVKTICAEYDAPIWLGLSDYAEEGVWNWINGESGSVTDWKNTQPDNHYDLEHFAAMDKNGWFDTRNTSKECLMLIEMDSFGYLTDTISFSVDSVAGKVSINGSGAIPNFGENNSAPWAEFGKHITKIDFSEGIHHIGDNVFANCERVDNIKVPVSLNSIGDTGLENTNWYKNKNDGIVLVGRIVYKYKGDIPTGASIILNDGVNRIAKTFSSGQAHTREGLESLHIASSVNTIEEGALANFSGLSSLTVHSANPYYRSVKNVIYSKDLTKLVCCPAGLAGEYAVPDSVTHVSAYAFAGCSQLQSISLGKNIESIGEHAFDGTSLQTIYGYYGSYAQEYAQQNSIDFTPYVSTVTFDFEDDSGQTLQNTYFTGTEIGSLASPVRNGYHFEGWYYISDEDENIYISDSFVVSESVTVYASWSGDEPGERFITGIAISGMPVKTNYLLYEMLQTNGLELRVTYNNNDIENISTGYSCVPNYLNNVGEQQIDVHYAGFSANFMVTVSDILPTGINILSLPKTQLYFVDDSLNEQGMRIKIQYNNGTSKLINTARELEITYDFSGIGNKQVVVRYTEKGVSLSSFFYVQVINRPLVYSAPRTINSGEYVAIPVYISDNCGIMGFSINMDYDMSVMTPKYIVKGSILGGSVFDNISASSSGTLCVFWAGTSNMVSNGLLFTAYFEVSRTAETGEYPIEISYSSEDTFNETYADVKLSCDDTIVTVINTASNITTIYIDNTSVINGNVVSVPINVTNNSGFNGMAITLNYDKEVFTYISISPGIASINTTNVEDGSITVILSGIPGNAGDGSLFQISLLAKSKTTKDHPISIACSNDEIVCCDGIVSVVNPIENLPTTITLEADETSPGTMVEIPVKITNNKGVMGYKLNFTFDKTQVTPRSIRKGFEYAGSLVDNIGVTEGVFSVLWNSIEDMSLDGVLFYILFEVSEEAELGDTEISVAFSPEDTFNEQWEDVVFKCSVLNLQIYDSDRIVRPAQGSSTVINRTNNYIYGVSSSTLSIENIISIKSGYSVVCVPVQNTLGTGTKVNVYFEGNIVESYTIIIFGDVTGDGNIGSPDADRIIDYTNWVYEWDATADGAYLRAADVNGDGVVDAVDADIIIEYENWRMSINQATGFAVPN